MDNQVDSLTYVSTGQRVMYDGQAGTVCELSFEFDAERDICVMHFFVSFDNGVQLSFGSDEFMFGTLTVLQ